MWKFLKNLRLSLILLAAIILLIFLHYLNITTPIENFLINIFAPGQKTIYSFGTKINKVYSNLTSRGDLVAQNEKLSQDLSNTLAENSKLKVRISELEAMANQQNFLKEFNYSGAFARVIGKNPTPNLQALILDQGSKSGILEGSAVIANNGILIGKIFEVKKNSSQVILVTDAKSRIAAMIENEKQTKGIVIGEHGLSLKMDLIPQADEIKIGQTVSTSGLEANIPRGLVIGQVSRIIKEPNDFFQVISLQSPVRLDDLIVGSVIKNFSND